MTSSLPRIAFEDATPGRVFDLGSKTVSAEEIVEFAAEFDPQPFHLDAEAGRNSILGGLAASGWHTTCILMRLMCDGLLLDATAQGSPGVEFVRWRKPVLAGDTLTGRAEVVETRLSKSRPGIGLVTLLVSLTNQDGALACDFRAAVMFATRSSGTVPT